MLKGIIFDFDGVIVESVQIKSNAFSEIYKPYGTEIVNKIIEHHEANGGMSRFEKIKFYHESLLNQSITKEEIVKLANQFSEQVIDKVIMSPYIPSALEYIQNNYGKYKLFISTGTPTKEIQVILKKRSIDKYFDGIFGSPEKKYSHIEEILLQYGFESNELIFYGDSSTDLNAAKLLGVEFILVCNIYNIHISSKFNGRKIIDFSKLI